MKIFTYRVCKDNIEGRGIHEISLSRLFLYSFNFEPCKYFKYSKIQYKDEKTATKLGHQQKKKNTKKQTQLHSQLIITTQRKELSQVTFEHRALTTCSVEYIIKSERNTNNH